MDNFMTAAGSTTYAYDAQGRRVRKTVSSTVTDYFYSGSELIAEKTGSAWTDYVFFADQRIAKQTGTTLSTTAFLHADHLGSVRVCTDSNGNSTGTCDYEPFGETQPGTTCSVPTNFRFAGMEWDASAGPNGLYHTWFRYYDPNQGRWMAVDPFAGDGLDPQSLGRYPYALNDPANLTDPLGLWVFENGRLQTEFTFNGLAAADFLIDAGVLDWYFFDFMVFRSRPGSEHPYFYYLTLQELLALQQGKKPQEPQEGCVDKECLGDCQYKAGVNFALGFVPGYNAARFLYEAVEGEDPGASGTTTAAAGAASLNHAYRIASFEAANVGDKLGKAGRAAAKPNFWRKSPRFQKEIWAKIRWLSKLKRGATGAGLVANLLNVVDAGVEAFVDCPEICNRCKE